MNNKAQNVTEYVLLVVAVIVVSIAFFKNGSMSHAVNAGMNTTIAQLQNITNEIKLPPQTP